MMILYLTVSLVIAFVTYKWISHQKNKQMPDPFQGMAQIKPHWFWGNSDTTSHYWAMKGLRFCIFYHGWEKRLFILDPDLANRITITDFNHFVDSGFLDPEYTKVSRLRYICYEASRLCL